jgi:hypothetical protein
MVLFSIPSAKLSHSHFSSLLPAAPHLLIILLSVKEICLAKAIVHTSLETLSSLRNPGLPAAKGLRMS